MSEYGVSLTDGPHDNNNLKYVGWQELGVTNPYTLLFSQQNVNNLSKAITTYLWSLNNTAIVIPDQEIREIITSVWNSEKGGQTSGIYTQDTFDIKRTPFKRINEIVIQTITSQVVNTHQMAECNNSMDIWNQLYGDFNKAGLRAHPKIKLREKHPQLMMFNMNY